MPSTPPFPVDDVLFSATWAHDPQEKVSYSYTVVTNSYTAGDNQLHDGTIIPQRKLAGTYYNESIFKRVIKYRKWASSQD